ncbi:MAG: arylesterase [Betaproteobacteria bacterium]|nr:arylesterase [Betaproteobacteria bacterium]MDE2478074.1 arylesterase [Betaproteobacteria bacterium]
MLLALAACSRAFAADAPAARPVLLVIGDSLSAGYGLETGTGWVALLQKRLQERHAPWRVVNASISGETTAGGMSGLPALLQRDQPKVVLIELGGNDALRGLSLAATESNLRSMASACQMFGARVLLVGMRIPPNYGAAYTRGFEAIFPRVAQLQHTALVPFLLAGVVDHPDWFQADNIHPTAAAQPTMLDTVWPVLEPLLQSQARKPGARKP